jgi:hypothetical protein
LARALTAAAIRTDSSADVTTKVGIAPVPAAPPARRLVGRVVRLLPGPIVNQLRGSGRSAAYGRFGVEEVRRSVELSLERLGPLDRLLLHEARPDDISDDLLALLAAYRRDGSVGQVGVATQNDITSACVRRAPDVLTAVHLTVGPLSDRVALPESVTTRVGHGLLGPGAAHLRAVEAELRSDRNLRERWTRACADTSWAGPGGLAAALMAEAVRNCTGVIVATSRPERLATVRDLLEGSNRPTAEIVAVLAEAIGRARARRARAA